MIYKVYKVQPGGHIMIIREGNSYEYVLLADARNQMIVEIEAESSSEAMKKWEELNEE